MFKTITIGLGLKVYGFGNTMAISIIGKKIKVTDRIISSNTGLDEDITKYQITFPIQG